MSSYRRDDRQSGYAPRRDVRAPPPQRDWDAPSSHPSSGGGRDYDRSKPAYDRDGRSSGAGAYDRDGRGGAYDRDRREPPSRREREREERSSRRSMSPAARGEAASSRRPYDDRDRAPSGRVERDRDGYREDAARGHAGSRDARPPPPLRSDAPRERERDARGTGGREAPPPPRADRDESSSRRGREDDDRREATGKAKQEDEAGTKEMEEDEEEDDVIVEQSQEELMASMGFGGFGTTKGKGVEGNAEGFAEVRKERSWRQYMNRVGGFNRPLDRI